MGPPTPGLELWDRVTLPYFKVTTPGVHRGKRKLTEAVRHVAHCALLLLLLVLSRAEARNLGLSLGLPQDPRTPASCAVVSQGTLQQGVGMENGLELGPQHCGMEQGVPGSILSTPNVPPSRPQPHCHLSQGPGPTHGWEQAFPSSVTWQTRAVCTCASESVHTRVLCISCVCMYVSGRGREAGLPNDSSLSFLPSPRARRPPDPSCVSADPSLASLAASPCRLWAARPAAEYRSWPAWCCIAPSPARVRLPQA